MCQMAIWDLNRRVTRLEEVVSRLTPSFPSGEVVVAPQADGCGE